MSFQTAVSADDVAASIPDAATIMIGGFMGVGSPQRTIKSLVRRGARDLTVICNDTAWPGRGMGHLITAGAVSRLITTHIGLNPETQKQMNDGELAVELVPQGTLIERIRAGGFGLGGILTPTGLGTEVQEGKRQIEVNGKLFLLEEPLTADFALIAARRSDYVGNLEYALTVQNFNPIMALADETVIAEPENIVPVGVIPPDAVRTPGILIDRLVREGWVVDAKEMIARRVAQEVQPKTLVNLGIGLPSLVANFIPSDHGVFFQAENGVIGMGARPPEGMEEPDLTDAGGGLITAVPGAASMDSAFSFGLIRGGHVDLTVLGGLEVDQCGRLANWKIPGAMVPGMGGAMDLVTGARRVIAAMLHRNQETSKLVRQCHLPITSTRPVDLVITELAVLRPETSGFRVIELMEGAERSELERYTAVDLLWS